MIDRLIALSITSLWIALGGIPVLFFLRLAAVLLHKADRKTALSVLFFPFGIGYFRSFPARDALKFVYRTVVAIVFFFSLLAAFWVLYTHFA